MIIREKFGVFNQSKKWLKMAILGAWQSPMSIIEIQDAQRAFKVENNKMNQNNGNMSRII